MTSNPGTEQERRRRHSMPSSYDDGGSQLAPSDPYERWFNQNRLPPLNSRMQIPADASRIPLAQPSRLHQYSGVLASYAPSGFPAERTMLCEPLVHPNGHSSRTNMLAPVHILGGISCPGHSSYKDYDGFRKDTISLHLAGASRFVDCSAVRGELPGLFNHRSVLHVSPDQIYQYRHLRGKFGLSTTVRNMKL